ncbi:hypothetical protein HOK51_04125 [Candidatus Woesearchaeota archaeon]|jgi:hypothetical protein|nr:hypothetical protein [Candidatus Woesearchaeota archaeon]MBT6519009.1 hypothetical protein [Candidatus Woesearchaeota archaeon]MBT7368792.1 hypothetical protein [Candidatus Woesearchaeota archaeon]
MKKYQKLGIGILATTIALSSISCKKEGPNQTETKQEDPKKLEEESIEDPIKTQAEQTKIRNNLQVGLDLDEPQNIDGVITEITPGEFNYFVHYSGSEGYGCNHSITWVTIKNQGELKTLLYPTSGAIHKGNAKVTYREVAGGQLNQLDFIKANVVPRDWNKIDAHTRQKTTKGTTIPVEGIIDLDGIDYNL